MGFLLFAYRKLSLKRQINSKNYHLMTVSNEQQRIQSQISIMQQTAAAVKDTWTMSASLMSESAGSVFAMQAQTAAANSKDASNEYYKAMQAARKEGLNNDIQDAGAIANMTEGQKAANDALTLAKDNMEKARTESNETAQRIYFGQQAAQQSIALANNLVESVFSAAEKGQMSILQAQDQRLTLDKEHTESELSLLSAEYDSVKKAEGDAAKNAAPQFTA